MVDFQRGLDHSSQSTVPVPALNPAIDAVMIMLPPLSSFPGDVMDMAAEPCLIPRKQLSRPTRTQEGGFSNDPYVRRRGRLRPTTGR